MIPKFKAGQKCIVIQNEYGEDVGTIIKIKAVDEIFSRNMEEVYYIDTKLMSFAEKNIRAWTKLDKALK